VAKTGDRFEMPDNSIYEVTAASADSGGEFVGMNFTLPVGSVAPPPHIHPTLEESFEVLEGEFDLMVDGDWTTLQVGESASVAAGTLHTFRNRCGKTIRVRNRHSPAAHFEDYIEHIYLLMEARGIKGVKNPKVPIYLSMLMLEYPDTIRPGRARERIGMKALAATGRVFGMRTGV
jgi:quercetin dioxygenase-like cupin family protein